ncbi:MAG: stage II sporulation protein R [Clostridia bacterium]|nr:stage II sporulation protein R [Clostridia bacterium]
MKNVCIIFLLSIIISLTAFGVWGTLGSTGASNASGVTSALGGEEYLRIHIRADSNEGEAQAVKYYVRDAIVEYLTPLVAGYQTQAQAVEGVREHLSKIAVVATQALLQRGYGYGATAELKRETFPTRVYDGYTLPSGEYTALIVNLGSGKGDNWWCVVYPPLCFVAPVGENVVYKSKIKEIIMEWKAR